MRFIVALLALLWLAMPVVADEPPAIPAAPLALATGRGVSLAWTLPQGLRPGTVVVYRADKQAQAFEEIARLDAAMLSLADEKVTLGHSYLYRVELLRGTAKSGMSPATEVLVGGGARLMLVGGSTERAVFEVSLFAGGKRLSQVFAHSPGEKIGDLVHVAELQKIVDFRLGCTLRELSLTRALTEQTQRLELVDTAGKPMRDLAGNPVALDFRFAGAQREALSAMVALPDGRVLPLLEGAVLTMP